jgi:hypothetical protein
LSTPLTKKTCRPAIQEGNLMAIQFKGNPFTHFEQKRESVGPGVCAWCGTKRKVLFKYNNGKPVCNLECNKAYYG